MMTKLLTLLLFVLATQTAIAQDRLPFQKKRITFDYNVNCTLD